MHAPSASSRFVSATGLACLRRWYDPVVQWCAREREFKAHLLEVARPEPEANILDVGCGSGTLALSLVACQPAAQVIGIDADHRMLRQAQQKPLADRIEWQVGNAIDLPFDDNTFDQVFCTLVLHHLQPVDKHRSLREMWRVLRPGATFFMADYGRPASWLAGMRFIPARLIDGWQCTHCNVAGRLPQLILEAGFGQCHETLVLDSLLGTIRCMRAEKNS